jgi:hypothetical protein
MAHLINFTDSSIAPEKSAFAIPEYKTEGPTSPLNSTPNSGTPPFNSAKASTTLLLVGKGVPNYGEIIQNNLVHLLENFASNGVPPVYPTIGQLWYNYQTKELSLYKNTNVWDGILSLSGGIMTGPLHLSGSPVTDDQAVNKKYVDNLASLYVLLDGTNSMTGLLTLSGDPTTNLQAATKQYVDNSLISHESDLALHLTPTENVWIDSITATSAEVNYLSGSTSNIQFQLNQKVAKTGDTMTGLLVLSGNPVDNLGAAPKQYVDTSLTTALSQYLPLSGGIQMTGFFDLVGNPVSALQPATKQYVDAVAGGGGGGDGVVTGGSMDPPTGILTLSRSVGGNVLINNIAAFTHTHTASDVSYVILSNTGILNYSYSVSPNYPNITVLDALSSFDRYAASTISPTFSGTVTLGQDPVLPLEAATKQYVDTSLTTTLSQYLPLSGGIQMTGFFDLVGNPVSALQPATKQYTDNKTTIQRTLITSTGQTVFDFTTSSPNISYVVGSNNLWVFVNGIKAYITDSYLETSTTSVTFTYTVPVGVNVEFLVFGI